MAGIKFDARKGLTLTQLAQILTMLRVKHGARPVAELALARIESKLAA